MKFSLQPRLLYSCFLSLVSYWAFPTTASLTPQSNARQTGRQIHRCIKTDRQTDWGINPWLWSRKQCQMLLVMSTYNHFVRHDVLRTSKYILYTKVSCWHVATPLPVWMRTAHQMIIAQRGIQEAMSNVNTHTLTSSPCTYTLASHSTWGVDFRP